MFTETDDNNVFPDNNIGFDTLPPAFLPGAWGLMILGFAGVGAALRRRLAAIA